MTNYKTLSEEYSLRKTKKDFNQIKITDSKSAVNYARQFYFDDIGIYESFFLILLNRTNRTIGYAKISQGGISGTVVDVKIIAKYAIESLASGIILVHNHPSGNTLASDQDISITNKIKSGLSFFEISVLDHIILTEDSYNSFADEGLL